MKTKHYATDIVSVITLLFLLIILAGIIIDPIIGNKIEKTIREMEQLNEYGKQGNDKRGS